MKSLVLALAASVAFATADARQVERPIIGAEQDHSLAGESAGDCESFYRTTFSSFDEQVHSQEQRELDLQGVQQIRVAAAPEGGLSIRGWSPRTPPPAGSPSRSRAVATPSPPTPAASPSTG
jgi:hypothetical protein